MAKPVKCFICPKKGLKVEMVKIQTPVGEKYACPGHPGIDEIKIK